MVGKSLLCKQEGPSSGPLHPYYKLDVAVFVSLSSAIQDRDKEGGWGFLVTSLALCSVRDGVSKEYGRP